MNQLTSTIASSPGRRHGALAAATALQASSACDHRVPRRTATPYLATAAAFAACLLAAGCAPKHAPQAADQSAAAKPATAAETTASETKTKEVVQPDAVKALQKMSTYLQTLSSFELTTNTSLDLVNEHGQRLTVDGSTVYKVHRPDGFMIDLRTDYKNRRFYYDGKQVTVYAPDFGYYATAPAAPTIRETLDLMAAKYDIKLPLEDLFRWSDPAANHVDSLTSAFHVGSATLDGVATDHYAFREGDEDWQVWIQQGDKPLPLRLVIVDRTDPANPTYDARLSWKPNSVTGSDQFVFKPGHDDKHIRLASMASS